MTPFIVYSLPRSRSFWLSQFLTYGEYRCYHEQVANFRAVDDLKSWLSQDFTGTAETSVAPGWQLIRHYRPDIRTVVVRRPVEDVMKSALALDLSGICTYDVKTLGAALRRIDRALDRIEAEVPGALSVSFDGLNDEATCARVFEHCLPYRHDADWYASIATLNLQHSVRAMMRYRLAFRPQIERFKSACWSDLRRLRKTGEIS